jgi:TAG lipase/steryl ester hydrolase/phospholipase A2/LPA acyltransferase
MILNVLSWYRVLSNPVPENVERAMKVGRQAAWRKMAMVSNHCKIEIALDDIVRALQGVERWTIN